MRGPLTRASPASVGYETCGSPPQRGHPARRRGTGGAGAGPSASSTGPAAAGPGIRPRGGCRSPASQATSPPRHRRAARRPRSPAPGARPHVTSATAAATTWSPRSPRARAGSGRSSSAAGTPAPARPGRVVEPQELPGERVALEQLPGPAAAPGPGLDGERRNRRARLHQIFSMLTRNALYSGVLASASPTNGVSALASQYLPLSGPGRRRCRRSPSGSGCRCGRPSSVDREAAEPLGHPAAPRACHARSSRGRGRRSGCPSLSPPPRAPRRTARLQTDQGGTCWVT